MNETAMIPAGANPFSTRAALLLVLFGAAVFLLLLWMIGAGMTGGGTNDGGGHADGRGLNGYAAWIAYLEKRGAEVDRVRSEARLDAPGLLVLTPPQRADGKELDRIVSKRRYVGPTLVVTPKWMGIPLPPQAAGGKKGWVQLAGTQPPAWPGFLDDVGVTVSPMRAGGKTAHWSGAGLTGELPDSGAVLSGTGERLVPLVIGTQDGRILAAYVDDGGNYPALRDMALGPAMRVAESNSRRAPIILVFEPDLLDNYGMANRANAVLGERLVRAATAGQPQTVLFDLTLNGHGRSTNLLTLAFTPPYLAATLCLLLAALAVGWRAFLRFGPPRKAERAIAFGKAALVANAAGLVRRTRRLHLVAGPYLDRTRDRIVKALALPREADEDKTDAAIDRALGNRAPDATPFSQIAARLRAARTRHDLVDAARDLHSLERTLIG